MQKQVTADANVSLAGEIGELLTRRRLTVAVAESCTGGLLGHCITSVPGSSAYFRGGVVAYADDVKCRLLAVEAERIARDGAVSAGVARTMAEGVRSVLSADIGIGITGVAGPDGGSAEKPVGLVFVGIAGDRGSEAREFRFEGNRGAVKGASVFAALQMLRERLTPGVEGDR